MAKVILKTDQTHTPDADILGTDAYGEYQLFCDAYTSSEIYVQIRREGGTWKNARYNGNDIKLTAEGDVLDITVKKGFDYRLFTETAGAEVWIAKDDPHGS